MTNTDTTQTTQGYMNADRSRRPSPWWYCLFIIVAVLLICILSSEFVQAQTGQGGLRGISRVRVEVGVAGDDLPSGTSGSRLRTITELKLRTAGLGVLSEEEYLADPDAIHYVGLSLTAILTEEFAWYSVSTGLTVLEFRYQAARDAVLPVQLWVSGGLNTIPLKGAASVIEREVGQLLDGFLNDWLAANPRR